MTKVYLVFEESGMELQDVEGVYATHSLAQWAINEHIDEPVVRLYIEEYEIRDADYYHTRMAIKPSKLE